MIWLYETIRRLSAEKVQRGGFVYAGAPDIQGMEYMKLFDYATDKLAELKHEDWTPELAQQEKEAFRNHLVQNFG